MDLLSKCNAGEFCGGSSCHLTLVTSQLSGVGWVVGGGLPVVMERAVDEKLFCSDFRCSIEEKNILKRFLVNMSSCTLKKCLQSCSCVKYYFMLHFYRHIKSVEVGVSSFISVLIIGGDITLKILDGFLY